MEFVKRPLALQIVMLLHLLMLIDRGLANSTIGSFLDSGDVETRLCSRTSTMDPFHEVKYGQDVVWQIPLNPKAVLFMAHGMNKEPLSYFDPGPNCKQCYGFPEDRALVLEALCRRYAVIVIKSIGSLWQPWNVESWPPENSTDRLVVNRVIKEWTRDYSLDHLPLAAFGYSSGGNFSTILTLDLDIRSLVIMCTSGEFLVLEHATAQFPPTLFVTMPVDNDTYGFYRLEQQTKQILMSKGVVVRDFEVFPTAVSPLFFSERIPCLDGRTSEKIYAAFKAEGWLDENNFLLENPRLSDWEGVLWKWKALPFCKKWNNLCLAQHVQQELLMAYAEHSMTSLASVVVYSFLDTALFARSSSIDPTASKSSMRRPM